MHSDISKLYFQVLVEVICIDQWSRYRVEGYGHSLLPTTPGCHTLNINTWRPVTTSHTAQMRRFFIGGTPELEDVKYCGNNNTGLGPVHSRFGFQTRSGGSVTVRTNIIHQAKAFLLASRSSVSNKRRPGARTRTVLMDRLSSATLFSSVNTVLAAFQKAREKMAKATEGLDRETLKALQEATLTERV